MDQKLMNANRLSIEYWNDVEEFIKFIVEHANGAKRIKCPYIRCGCLEKVMIEVLKDYLFISGLTKVIQDANGMMSVQEKDGLLQMIEYVMKKKKLIVVRVIN